MDLSSWKAESGSVLKSPNALPPDDFLQEEGVSFCFRNLFVFQLRAFVLCWGLSVDRLHLWRGLSFEMSKYFKRKNSAEKER